MLFRFLPLLERYWPSLLLVMNFSVCIIKKCIFLSFFLMLPLLAFFTLFGNETDTAIVCFRGKNRQTDIFNIFWSAFHIDPRNSTAVGTLDYFRTPRRFWPCPFLKLVIAQLYTFSMIRPSSCLSVERFKTNQHSWYHWFTKICDSEQSIQTRTVTAYTHKSQQFLLFMVWRHLVFIKFTQFFWLDHPATEQRL